tara:strand:+ start:1665 stop:2228 length:564 start_codon:yes stop_codon:yes gene_type:complete
MPPKDLYSASMAAGKAAGKYSSTLADISGVGDEMSFYQREAAMNLQQQGQLFGAIGAGMELTSTLYGGWQDRQERKETMGDIQTKMVEHEFRDPKGKVGRDFDTFEEFKKSDMFTEAREKYKPQQTTSFLDRLMGKEKKYQFGESPYELSKTDISLWGKFGQASKMEKFFGDKYSSFLDASSLGLDE